jgi:general secretion pathway protein C
MQAIREHRSVKQLLNRLPDYLSLLLVILCGFLLARLLWALYPAETTAFDESLTQTQASAQTTTDTPDVGAQIADLHLFGQPAVEPPTTPTDTKNLQTSQLAFKLAGVVSGDAGQIVIEDGGKQSNYRVGEDIASGVRLQAVFADHIVILRNGTPEKIALPALTGSGSAGFVTSTPDFAMQDPLPPIMDDALLDEMNTPIDIPPNLPDGMSPDQPMEMNEPQESLLESGVELSIPSNPAQLTEIVTPEPHEANGKFVGFRLMPGSNVGLFNQLGLQPGDIVTAINGTPLDSPAAGAQALSAAASSPQVNLSLTRGGQQLNLPISLGR